jgi:hypothetical protein
VIPAAPQEAIMRYDMVSVPYRRMDPHRAPSPAVAGTCTLPRRTLHSPVVWCNATQRSTTDSESAIAAASPSKQACCTHALARKATRSAVRRSSRAMEYHSFHARYTRRKLAVVHFLMIARILGNTSLIWGAQRAVPKAGATAASFSHEAHSKTCDHLPAPPQQ